MDIFFIESSMDRMPEYIKLYRACFPHATHLNMKYLTWLYLSNPDGVAIGMDALHDGKLVGSIVLIPGLYSLYGKTVKGLLALNTVVHPDYQGKQIFKKLGLCVSDYAAQLGYSFIIGVANAAATPGWIKHIGFQLVAPLQTKLGLGGLGIKNYKQIYDSTQIRRIWGAHSLDWRASNPVNPISFDVCSDSKILTAYASTGKYGFSAVADILPTEKYLPEKVVNTTRKLLPRVFIGLIPNPQFGMNYIAIPNRFKPSPLNFIFKNLVNENDKIASEASLINFLDFDAF